MASSENGTEYPVREILENVAQSRGISLVHFTQKHFLPEAQKGQHPLLCDLSVHLAYPYGLGIEVEKDGMVAFEGSHNSLAMAYFGREVEEYSNYTREQALIHSGGRRIHIILNENGNGKIEVQDLKSREARYKLGEDSCGSFNVHPEGSYGFRQKLRGSDLSGVKGFLETIIA